jgi:hypothetical protein
VHGTGAGLITARRVKPLLTKRNAPRDGRPIQAG